MQNIKTKDFQKKLSDNGYEPVRQKGSHTVYEAKRTITDSLSVPTNDKTINGCLAKRLEKQIEDFMRR
jgi:predicted RNA binding protein YcfA (HicA-like mRNA interferase family)